MNFLLRPFMYLALVGFFASIAVHLAGHMGIARPFGVDPWPLFAGIFVVWLPAVVVAHRLSKEFPQRDMWKATLRGCPPWMRKSLYVLVGYVVLNFFAFAVFDAQSADEADKLRGFTGHALIFYYVAFAIMYSARQVLRHDPVRRCKNGHVLRAVDKYCGQCGSHVGSVIG